MKRYTFQVVIEEGNDEFWEGLEKEADTTGRELVRKEVEDVLYNAGFFDAVVTLKKYEEVN